MQCGHKAPLQSIIWLQNEHLHNKLIYCTAVPHETVNIKPQTGELYCIKNKKELV